MGIEKVEYSNLTSKITKIYHSATYMNTITSYETLKEINVNGFIKLLEFASETIAKTIEYISTNDIFSIANNKVANEFTLLKNQIHYPSNGYASSKFVAEGIIETAREKGFDIKVYRLGLVTGDTILGKNESTQWFNDFLIFLKKFKVMPNSSQFISTIVPVDFVAKAIITLSQNKNTQNNFHLTSPFAISFLDLMQDSDISIIKYEKFLKMLQEDKNMSNHLSSINSNIITLLMLDKKSLEKILSNTIHIQAFNTMEILKKYGVKFPSIDTSLFSLYLDKAGEQ
jgi:thioester reductase-like protein